MRIILSILIGLCVLLNIGCSVSEFASSQESVDLRSGYEITIRLVEQENPFDRVMEIFSKNGLSIVYVHHIFFPGERQEIRVSVRNGDSKQLTDMEYQLKDVLKVENVSIRKI